MTRPAAPILMVAVLTAAIVMSQFFRSAIAVIAPDLRAQMDLSPETLGALSGAFFLAIGAMQIPVGILLDRFGPRRVIPTLLILVVAGTVVFAGASGPLGLIAGQALLGIGFSAGLVGGMVAYSRWFPVHRFAAIGALSIGISGFGVILSSVPFAWLTEAIGWRNGYLAMGGITAIILLAVAWVVRDAPPGHDYHARTPEKLGATIKGVGHIFADRRLWPVLLIGFSCYSTMFAIRGLWGGPYLADIHHMDVIGRGNVFLIMSIGTTIGVIIYGYLDQRARSRRALIVGGSAVICAAFAVLALVPRIDATLASTMFCVIGLTGTYSVLVLSYGRTLFPDHMVGRGITVINFVNFAGVAFMQVAAGGIIGLFAPKGAPVPEEAYRTMFAFLGLFLLVAAIVFARSGRRARAAGRG